MGKINIDKLLCPIGHKISIHEYEDGYCSICDNSGKIKKKNKQEIIVFQEPTKLNKPNILIDIAINSPLTLKEKKIYNIFVRQLLNKNIDDYSTRTVKTTTVDLCRELGIKNRTEIPRILQKLSDTSIKFFHILDDKKYQWNTKLISDFGIEDRNKDSLIISFSEVLTMEILKHNDKYTKLDLVQINELEVSHSITLYEVFRKTICNYSEQYKNYTETELREYLGLKNKYIQISEFNKQVIKKSINDININTFLKVELLKIERPNTKENQTEERIYKFKILQEQNPISFKKFREILCKLDSNKISYKSGKRTYKLDYQLLNDKEFDTVKSENKYWIDENQNTIPSDKAAKIYEYLYTEFCKSSIDFIENKLEMEVEDFK